MDEQHRRVDERTNMMNEEIDKSIRKIKGDTYRCVANCCDNETYSIRKMQSCVKSCNISLDEAQEFVNNEIERVQNRIKRCFMDCNDEVRDAMNQNPLKTHSQQEMEKYEEQLNNCTTKCIDNYCEALPNLEKTIKKFLSEKKNYNSNANKPNFINS